MSDLVVSVVPSVDLVHGQPMVSSLKVAEHFRRAHKNVLRDIKALDCSDGFRRLNFEPSSYLSAQGKEQPACRMTRDGFMFLVMGYTGPQAARMKEAYIQRFNELEARYRMSAGEIDFHRRCERELIRTQRQCIRLQNRVIKLQGKLLFSAPRPVAASASQGDLFERAA